MKFSGSPMAVYEEFLKFRDDFIKYCLQNSTYKDIRDGEDIRPFMVVRDETQFKNLKAKVELWEEYVDHLTELDPVRFTPDSTKFKKPIILENYSEIFLYKNEATSTRSITKEALLKRLQKYIDNLSKRTDSASRVMADIYREERELIWADPEENYKIRNTGHSEIVAHCIPKYARYNRKTYFDEKPKKERLEKLRVTFAGMIVYDPKGAMRVKLPTTPHYERMLTIENLATPIQCSLPIKGKIYRESDCIEARKAITKHEEKQKNLAKAAREKKKHNAKKREIEEAAHAVQVQDVIDNGASKLKVQDTGLNALNKDIHDISIEDLEALFRARAVDSMKK